MKEYLINICETCHKQELECMCGEITKDNEKDLGSRQCLSTVKMFKKEDIVTKIKEAFKEILEE